MAVNYDGLTRNRWPGTWSPGGDHPIVLNSEMRGGIHFVEGGTVEELTDIKGQRLVEGMIAYVKTSYTGVDGDTFYIYKSQSGETRDNATGALPNSSANWTKLVNSINEYEQLTVDNLFFDGNTISTTNTDGDLILSPNGDGTIIVPSGYMNRTGITNDSLVTKEYVDNLTYVGDATAIATPVGITNTDKGIAAFDSDQFTVTDGWATIYELDGGSY